MVYNIDQLSPHRSLSILTM